MRRILLLSLLAACGGGGGDTPDANSSRDDAAPSPDAAASPDAAPGCNTLFLDFEATDLAVGAENATTNHSSILTGAEAAPGYLQGDPDRATKIASIVDQVTTTLAPFGVTVVSTRPTSGDYSMVVVGGASTDLGFPAGFGGLAPFGAQCGVPIPHRISFAFDTISGTAVPVFQAGNIAIGGYLVGLDIPTSSDPNDCLCWDSPSCNEPAVCTIGGASTPRYQQSACGTGATFDEPAVITAGLTCP